ncbi:MazG-like family protein [Actinoplanes rectilineatus]|uniref:MazG-like family protein n=1 Tax=Actinoplanes rectilineatus TaxID=113571 RepID=UPI001FE216C1|nr:MazG-like family protein [Actinoplanes rectilineatus]
MRLLLRGTAPRKEFFRQQFWIRGQQMTDVGEASIWDTAVRWRAYLDEQNGSATLELTMRIAKIMEEAGEAVQAWGGVLGQNPRKGVTHTVGDVVGELAAWPSPRWWPSPASARIPVP